MKANMKKLLAMGLSVVLAVGCLTGCGDDKTSSKDGSTAKTEGEGGSSSSKKTFDDLGGMSIKIGDWYTSEDTGETDYAKRFFEHHRICKPYRSIQKDHYLLG